MSAAIDSASFHVIRSSTNRNKHLSCGNIQYGPVRSRDCTKENCKHVTLNTRPAEVHPASLYSLAQGTGPVAAAAAAGPLLSLQIRISEANANDYLPVNSVAKQLFKGLLPKQRIAWSFPKEIKREQLGGGGGKGCLLCIWWISMNNNEHVVFVFKVTGGDEGQA